MTKIEGLIKQQAVAEKDLAAARKQFTEAEKAFAAEETESLVEERPISEKVKRKLSEASDKHDGLKARVAALGRAIAEVRDQDEHQRDQRAYEAREAFRKKSASQVQRLLKALFAGRNEFLALLELMETEKVTVPNLADFIFPPADPTNPIDDMQLRFAQLSTLNGLSAWIREDALHSRSGPQQPPQEAR
jgi:hypothetical protein